MALSATTGPNAATLLRVSPMTSENVSDGFSSNGWTEGRNSSSGWPASSGSGGRSSSSLFRRSVGRTSLIGPGSCRSGIQAGHSSLPVLRTRSSTLSDAQVEAGGQLPVSEFLSVAEATWLALNVVSGGGSSSSSQPIGVTKIAKSVIAPLADHNISVFMLSTYQTDFILVQERDLPLMMHTLSSEFTLLRVVNGEAVAANSLGVTNGFVKPKLGSVIGSQCVLQLLRFPLNVLFTSASGELWKMMRIGGQPLGFDECGIVAQISESLAAADIPAYYISTFKFDHALVPEENIQSVIGALRTNEGGGQ
ncbi:UNVERIFIED_CONTAM: hypothetical protein FKN15_059917 [Acipenser sinensis]